MGIENPVHLIFIAAIALIFLGPKRLPELARAAGRMMNEFRAALNGEEHRVEDAVAMEDSAYRPPAMEDSAYRPAAMEDSAYRPAAMEDAAQRPVAASAPEPPVESPGHLAVAADDPAPAVGSADAPDRGPL